jgi:hypothetical protein
VTLFILHYHCLFAGVSNNLSVLYIRTQLRCIHNPSKQDSDRERVALVPPTRSRLNLFTVDALQQNCGSSRTIIVRHQKQTDTSEVLLVILRGTAEPKAHNTAECGIKKIRHQQDLNLRGKIPKDTRRVIRVFRLNRSAIVPFFICRRFDR